MESRCGLSLYCAAQWSSQSFTALENWLLRDPLEHNSTLSGSLSRANQRCKWCNYIRPLWWIRVQMCNCVDLISEDIRLIAAWVSVFFISPLLRLQFIHFALSLWAEDDFSHLLNDSCSSRVSIHSCRGQKSFRLLWCCNTVPGSRVSSSCLGMRPEGRQSSWKCWQPVRWM